MRHVPESGDASIPGHQNGTFQISFDTKTSLPRFAPMSFSALKDSFATVVGHLWDTIDTTDLHLSSNHVHA
jgi:hypothetical protein